MATATAEKKNTQAAPKNGAAQPQPEPQAPTISENFANRVQAQFVAEMGTPVSWTQLEKTLAQRLYVKIDASLKALEAKRTGNDKPPIAWANVNMTKLAIDAVNIVRLHIDATLKNFLHVIPYLNNATQKYDVDLRVGYDGRLFVHQKFALDPPDDVLCRLVYESDEFEAYLRDADNAIESYRHKPTKPFDRGRVVGGFGYISYKADPEKNCLILVTYKQLERSRKAGNTQFWGINGEDGEAAQNESYVEMADKTIIHRTCDKIKLDPEKINIPIFESIIHASEAQVIEQVAEDARQSANREVLAMPAHAESVQEIPTNLAAQNSESEKVAVAATTGGGQPPLTDKPAW